MSTPNGELELTDEMLSRNDEIDNAAYEFACTLAEKQLEWDMEWIAEITDAAKDILRARGIKVRHPGITTTPDGTQYYDDEMGD